MNEVLIQLCLHGRFGELFDQGREDAVLAGEVFAFTQGLKGCIHVESGCCHRHLFFSV